MLQYHRTGDHILYLPTWPSTEAYGRTSGSRGSPRPLIQGTSYRRSVGALSSIALVVGSLDPFVGALV